MKNFTKVFVALLVALAVIIPLVVAATAINAAPQKVIYTASEPTPTPTPINSGCHGMGC